jgi:predicted secreted protein
VLVLWLMSFMGALLLATEAAAVTVRLDASDASSSIVLRVGDKLRVELPSAPAQGFRWRARMLDASHLELLSRDLRPDSGRLDTAGTQVFVWKAISAGKAEIRISYGRAGDEGIVLPEKQMSISVQIAAGDPAPAVDLTLSSLATYSGSLPCGDCLDLAVELYLYGPQEPGKPAVPSVYVERRRYLGAAGGDRTVAETGKVTVLHGTLADPSMTVYVLAGLEGRTESLKVQGDRLQPLDPQMLPIQLPPGDKYGLKRTPDPGSGGTETPP